LEGAAGAGWTELEGGRDGGVRGEKVGILAIDSRWVGISLKWVLLNIEGTGWRRLIVKVK